MLQGFGFWASLGGFGSWDLLSIIRRLLFPMLRFLLNLKGSIGFFKRSFTG